MELVFHSSARGPSGLMVRVSEEYSEGLGFESQLDPRFFFHGFSSHCLNKKHHQSLALTVAISK